jgi:hypothetical protein
VQTIRDHVVCPYIWLNNDPLHPSSLLGPHLVQLASHNNLLTKQEESGNKGGQHGGHVEPKPAALPPMATLIVGYLSLGVALGMVIYSMKRGDYLLPVCVFLAFLPFALGLSLVLDGTYPAFFFSLYSVLPVCRYSFPYGVS